MNASVLPGKSAGMLPWLGLRLKALRAFSFPLSVLPVFVAVAAVVGFSKWRLDILAGSALGVLLLHAAGNLLNDYYDFRSGVDRKMEGDEGRPGRLLVHGELTPRDIFIEALVCLMLAVPVVSYLLIKCGPGLLWFGGVAMFSIYAYTGPPFKLKYRAAGELVIFFAFGPALVIGAAYAQTGSWEWPAALLSVPIGLATTSVLLGNNIRDTAEDKHAGVNTLAHRLGTKTAQRFYVFGVISPPLIVAGLTVFGVLSVGSLASIIALVPAYFLARMVWAGKRVPDIDARTARYVTVFLLTLWLGMVIWGQ